MLVPRIDGNGEKRIAAPFEAMLFTVRCFDRRRSVSLQNADDVFINMLERAGFTAGGNFETENGIEIVSPL